MKKTMIIGMLVVTLNLCGCMNDMKSSKNNTTNINKNEFLDIACNTNENFTLTTQEELVKLLIDNAKKYFDVNINENNFNYSVGKKVGFNNIEILKKIDDLEDIYIVANVKNVEDKSGVLSINMEYDSVKKKIESMSIAMKKTYDKKAQLSQQEAFDIAKKFISEKKLAPENVKLTISKFISLNGQSFLEVKYIENKDDEEIEIVIDNTNKIVTMFELD